MLPRTITVFAGVLLLGAFIPVWAVPGLGTSPPYWVAVVAIAAVAALAAARGRRTRTGGGTDGPPGGWLRRGEFLCDSCKYDHPDLCSRPERPNATRCPDYRSRG